MARRAQPLERTAEARGARQQGHPIKGLAPRPRVPRIQRSPPRKPRRSAAIHSRDVLRTSVITRPLFAPRSESRLSAFWPSPAMNSETRLKGQRRRTVTPDQIPVRKKFLETYPRAPKPWYSAGMDDDRTVCDILKGRLALALVSARAQGLPAQGLRAAAAVPWAVEDESFHAPIGDCPNMSAAEWRAVSLGHPAQPAAAAKPAMEAQRARAAGGDGGGPETSAGRGRRGMRRTARRGGRMRRGGRPGRGRGPGCGRAMRSCCGTSRARMGSICPAACPRRSGNFSASWRRQGVLAPAGRGSHARMSGAGRNGSRHRRARAAATLPHVMGAVEDAPAFADGANG
jgi:hypothetical protein